MFVSHFKFDFYVFNLKCFDFLYLLFAILNCFDFKVFLLYKLSKCNALLLRLSNKNTQMRTNLHERLNPCNNRQFKLPNETSSSKKR